MAYKFTVFSLLTTALFCADIDKAFIEKQKGIDIVESNGVRSFEYPFLNQSENYKPSLPAYDIQPKPLHYETKFGQMYLYDLTQNGAYLDASQFNTLIFLTPCKSCKIALADRDMFKKEDNLPITPDKNNTIDLHALFDKIDLQHLKYIILISKEPIKPELKVRFVQQETPKINLSKAVWIWNGQNMQSTAELSRHNISTIYLQINNGFKNALDKLPPQLFSVYGLDGKPSDILDFEHLRQDAKKLAALSKEGISIKGMQIDVEPYLLADFNQNRDLYYQKYLTMIRTLSEDLHQAGLHFSIVIPPWFDSVYVENKPLAFWCVDIADEVVLMSYRTDPKVVLHISSDILSYASYRQKNVFIGIELTKINDEKHTLYTVLANEPDTKASVDYDLEGIPLHMLHSYVLKGSSLSFYGQYDKVQQLIDFPVPYRSFQGFVLHHYDMLEQLP